jgi:hypothetical protein
MPTLNRSELARFLSEDLTAAAVMVPINDPIDPGQRVRDAYHYLKENKFDLALVSGDRLLVLSQAAAGRAAATTPTRHVCEVAESPRRDRVIERTLPLRQVTSKLREDRYPLLVVGGDAITHIINVADFAGVAGTAAALMALLTLDLRLNALLLTQADDAWRALNRDQRKNAQYWQRKAADKRAELESPLNYLSMSTRLQLVRTLGLAEGFGLGTEDQHEMLVNTRNAAAHGELHDPVAALRATDLAEQLLERLDHAGQYGATAAGSTSPSAFRSGRR